MRCVVLIIHDASTVEVEFVKDDGSGYEFEDNYTFTLKISDLDAVDRKSENK
jgi:hypothetical protein